MDPQIHPEPPKPPRAPLGAMNWGESVNYFLGKGTVHKAAIFDNGGKPLAAEPDMQITDQDARAIQNCVALPINVYDRSQFGLFIGQIRYLCFKVDKRTMIGVTKEELFVAHLCDDVMILAFVPIQLNSSTSCLGEVWTFAQELKSHIEVKQFVE